MHAALRNTDLIFWHGPLQLYKFGEFVGAVSNRTTDQNSAVRLRTAPTSC